MIAPEQKARKTYDNILRFAQDPDVIDPIRFLRERELVHFQRFGDALRIGAATGAEDEIDLSKIWFNLEYFDAFTKGFAEGAKDSLTKKEIELLALSAQLMTYECGIRFLTDYLNGDTYFRIHREHHNLDRCRTQFKLVKEMEEKQNELERIVKKVAENILK